MAQKRSRAAFEADLQARQSPYVFFGTPLPPLDPQTRDDGSYVPVWKQEVTDERGRKRLHGAFTGGFSAGYFNTVGSKEGWTPQAFISSRSKRAKPAHKAEDYMDEEDLADAEDAKVLETKGEFSGFGSTADEVGGRGPLIDLFRPQGETMGVALLRKMGWKEGQAIGRARQTPDALELHDPGGLTKNTVSTYASTKLISFVRKTDTKGLKLEDNSSSNNPPGRPPTKTAKVIKKKTKTGFGVGVLNDTGSDDEDPYDVGPKLSYSRTACEKKNKRNKDAGIVAPTSNPLLTSRPVYVKKNPSSAGFRRCHDGKLPIDGFVLSSKGPVTQEKGYKPPGVPEGWVPARLANSAFNSKPEYQSTAELAKGSGLDPTSRAAILGESVLPGQSVFDFLSPAARDKLAAATRNPNLPAGKLQSPLQPPILPSIGSLLPALDHQVAASALQRSINGFVPYADDSDKLTRYRTFLTYRSSRPDSNPASMPEPPSCPPGTRREDFLAELQEFANAAAIFKPVTGAMANRFTSSSSSSVGQTSASIDDDGKEIPLLSQSSGKLHAPEEEAAKMGMYGPLTRGTLMFFPTRLLCKRFGVTAPMHVQPEPENGSVARGSSLAVKKQDSETRPLSGMASRFASGGLQSSESDHVERKGRLELVGKKDMDEMRRAAGLPALGEVIKRKERDIVVDPNRNEILEAERPSEETFRQIFADDD